MKKRAKKLLIALIAFTVILHVVAVAWIALNSRDIPVPDTSDLVFETVSVSDEDNAYIYFKNARELFDYSDQESEQVDSILDGGIWDDEFVTGLISKNSEALNLLKRGLICPIYQRQEGPKSVKFQSLVKWIKMTELMALKAMHERRTMLSKQALDSCCDLLRFGSLIIAHPRSCIEYIIGLHILELGVNEIRNLLLETSFAETQLIRLFEHLKNISSLNEGLTSAIKADFHLRYRMTLDLYSELQNDNSIKHRLFHRYCFHPNRTKRMFATRCRIMIQNASRSYVDMDLPEVIFFDPDLRMFIQKLRPNGFAKLLLPHTGFFNSFLKGKCKPQAHLTAIRLVVACRIYEIKHGHLPDTLEHLVPKFFDDVPLDPFDGKPFRYLPKQAIVYSVGKDLKDLADSEKTMDMIRLRDIKKDKDKNDLIYNIHEYLTPSDIQQN